MATFLYSIGRFAFRRRRYVALVWVALLAVVGFGAATSSTTPGMSASIPGIEAQRAFDLLDERYEGASADGATARVVFKAPEDQQVVRGEARTTIEDTVGELGSQSDVASVVDPFEAQSVSRDGTAAYVQVSYTEAPGEVSEETQAALEAVVEEARESGLTVEAGGTALEVAPETGSGEIVGVVVAALVLVLTFGSLLVAGLPLATALIGVGIGVGGIVALAPLLDMSATTSILAAMLGLAVGIDYALFIVSRYRSERNDGHPGEHAAGRAVGTAGSAVVFAGLTVVIALAGLSVVGVPILTKMGLAAAATVAIAVLIAVTMVPALLGFAGDRALSRTARRAAAGSGAADTAAAGDTAKTATSATAAPEAEQRKPALGTRWAGFVLRRPVAVLIVAVLGLGLVAVPATQLELGMPDDGHRNTDTTQRKAYDLVAENFGPGVNGPLVVVVDAADSENPQGAAEQVSKTISGIEGVTAVTPPVFNQAGDTAQLTVIPAEGPSSNETEDLVHDIRDTSSGTEADTGAKTLVTGATALNIDFSQKLNDALVPYLALVVGLAFLLLMLVFRSVLVPLKAALGFLLSIVAALGAVVAVFQWGWLADLLGVAQTGPVVSMAPIFLIGVVFGLAMDYEVFLVTRMREAHVHGESPKEAITTGFRHGARVVSAAAVIMISVFAGFVGSDEPMIKMMGFGLAVAVFFDAFVVRMAIVPAVLALLGSSAWWLPRWLDRLLPSVDVEGEQLAVTEPATPPEQAASEPQPAGSSRA